MSLTHQLIEEKLIARFGNEVSQFETPYGMLTCTIAASKNLEVLHFLFHDEDLRFQFMTDLCAVHYPERKNEELAVVYHLHNLTENVRLRLKAFVPIEKPDIESARPVFAAAGWMERETFDFYGVNFLNHGDLRRILNVDEMDYFPMRKEYPLEDQTRTDKDDEMFGRS